MNIIRKAAFLLLATVSMTTASMAQTQEQVTVKGLLTDSVTGEGEPYATIRIAKKDSPDKALKLGITGKDGRFSEKINAHGTLTATITSTGRKPLVKEFTVKAGDKVADLGTLLIANANNELQQVVVMAQKPLVKADIDKITYNIEDDPESKSNTMLEMLRKVPLVTVDGEDNIKVNGKSSFKVYVNGKPNKMMSDNPTEVLKSLPANSVKNIEVITNPGPKYDAEGVGGILNIITTGSGLEGYTVTLRGDVRNSGAGGGAFGTVKSGKLTVSARYSYNYNDNPESTSESTRLMTGDITDTSADLYTTNRNKENKTNSHSGSLEASYEIDTLRLVTAEFGLWGYDGDNLSTGTANGMKPGTADELYFGRNLYNSNSSRFSINGGIDYQRLFKVKDRMLTLSYKISTAPHTSDSRNEYHDKKSIDSHWQSYIDAMKDVHTEEQSNTSEHTFQADYTTPIGKLHTVEAGVKYIIRNNTSENDRYERAGADAGYAPDTEHSSHYRHRNDILAAYTGYGLKYKKISGRLGLRFEHTMQDVEYRLGRGKDFSKDFNDFVPSASIGYKLTDMSNLRLGYNMRIYRPGIWYLNPYLNDSNPTYIEQGNPELTSEKTHSVGVSYSNFTSKLNINIHTGYSVTNNSIEGVTELVSDLTLADKGLQNPTGKEVIYSTYKNIGKIRTFSVSGYFNWNATASTRIYSNIYGQYSHLEDGSSLRNHGWYMNMNTGVQQSFPKDWRISANCFHQTPWVMLQGKGTSWTDYGLNVSKSFMKKRLTISAFANNFFKKYRTMTYYTMQGPNFASSTLGRRQMLRYGVSVNFRIGELKASVKKAERTISNDDTKSGNSN